MSAGTGALKTIEELADDVITACALDERAPGCRGTLVSALSDAAKGERIRLAAALVSVFWSLPSKSEGRDALEAVLDSLGVPR